MANKAKFSAHGLNYEAAIDVAALSDVARRERDPRRVVIGAAAGQKQTAVFLQNLTVPHNLGAVGIAGTLKAAHLAMETLPAGGALTVQVAAYDASANAQVILTNTVNPEAATVEKGQAFTLATTNTALAADDTIRLLCTADNSVVSQDAQGVTVTLVWERTETDPPTR